MNVVANGSNISVDLDLTSRKDGVYSGEDTLARPGTLLNAIGVGRMHDHDGQVADVMKHQSIMVDGQLGDAMGTDGDCGGGIRQ